MLQAACDKQVQRGINSFKSQRQFDTILRRIQQSSSISQKSLSTTSTSSVQTDSSSSDKLDPRELDDFLAEITLINASCELYLRFLRRRLNADCEAAYPLVDGMKTEACLNQLKDIERFISHSDLSRILHEFINQYITIEDYFMRESIYKALIIDSPNMVDDVFFILRKCLKYIISKYILYNSNSMNYF